MDIRAASIAASIFSNIKRFYDKDVSYEAFRTRNIALWDQCHEAGPEVENEVLLLIRTSLPPIL